MEHKPIVAVLNDWGSVSKALELQGARTIEIDNSHDLTDAIQYVDAIVLTGGGDVDPARYGAERHAHTQSPLTYRDELEFLAVNLARKRRLPMLGICRGHQLLNVAHGGSLIQHLNDLPHAGHHNGSDHAVALREKSRVARAIGATFLKAVTSLHHQAVDRLGDGLVPVGWAMDGTVEMFESAPGVKPYVLGTQFHPEFDYKTDKFAEGMFRFFVEVTLERAIGRGEFEERWKQVWHLESGTRKSYTFGGYGDGYGWDNDDWPKSKPSSVIITQDRASELGSGYGDLYDEEFEMWREANDIGGPGMKRTHGTAVQFLNQIDAHCMVGKCVSPMDCGQFDDCSVEAIDRQASIRSAREKMPTEQQQVLDALLDNIGSPNLGDLALDTIETITAPILALPVHAETASKPSLQLTVREGSEVYHFGDSQFDRLTGAELYFCATCKAYHDDKLLPAIHAGSYRARRGASK